MVVFEIQKLLITRAEVMFLKPKCVKQQIGDWGDRWDGLEKGDQLLRMGFSQRDDMTAHSSETCTDAGVEKEVHDGFSKVGFPLHEAENSHEVTSPNKPKKEYQAGVTVEEHKPAHEACIRMSLYW